MFDIRCMKGIGAIIGVLNRVEEIAKETPPTNNAVSRFGNPAFKVFYDRVHDVCSLYFGDVLNFLTLCAVHRHLFRCMRDYPTYRVMQFRKCRSTSMKPGGTGHALI